MTLPLRSEASASRVHALLGPTNTGKTHRAIERMLDFESGMIGLPLRLLAREVYDRVSARVGEQAVALITGEEKRVPRTPRYFICTVEAMPRDAHVEFLAIDEIQLIANPERGHVFTDRLLYWRGSVETWFLGSDTINGLLREQLSAAGVGSTCTPDRARPGTDPATLPRAAAELRVHRLPRLSQLRHLGACSLRTLPRRSAVVTFSMPHVYELADVLRVRRGGAAIVLGALSPRVRNAQVALYESGEVDYLVATDAIGMGLNLDIDHVALAANSKFDGFETRSLEAAEIAQIVGRAGRYLRDGSFGTLAPQPELSARSVSQLESHHFPAQRIAYYRNSALDFASLVALAHALARPPPNAGLRSAPEADDVRILHALARRPEVRAMDGDASRVESIWDVCRIPNYEKRLPEHQAERLIPLISQRIEHGRLRDDYLHENVRRLERYDGDIDSLLERLAAVRTWTYISHQTGWVDDAPHWRERTRTLEDRLSDVLHERLVSRFVQTRSGEHWFGAATHAVGPSSQIAETPAPSAARPELGVAPPGRDAVRTKVSSRARVASGKLSAGSGNLPFAKLAELDIYRSAEREAVQQRADWIERLVTAPFDALGLDPTGTIEFEDQRVARITAGQSLLRPTLKLTLPDWIHPGAQHRIERRLLAHAKDLVAHLLSPLYPNDRPDLLRARDNAPLRGLLYQLEQGLGAVQRHQVAAQLHALTKPERAALQRWNIELGSHSVFAHGMLSQDRLFARAALLAAASPPRPRDASTLPLSDLTWPLVRGLDRHNYLRLGFVPLSHWAIRCDVLERLLAHAARLSGQDPELLVEEARIALGCSDERAREIVRDLPRRRRRRKRQRSGRALTA